MEVAGKAAAAALQNTVYQLLSETFSNEYQFGFRYIRKRRQKGKEGFLRKKPVMINQTEKNKEKTAETNQEKQQGRRLKRKLRRL